MNKISVIGLDLAKDVFQVHGINTDGEVVVRKQLKRSQVRRFFANLEPCLVGVEACGGAHYWSRELTELGHTVRMMAPVFVKPYLKSNKNDRNDAEAICEAVQRPSMRFVQPKTPEQQAVLHLHRRVAYLAWAFIEAANFARRYHVPAQRFYERKKARTNNLVATKALAHKLARACYRILKEGKPFDVARCFA